ncbi:MAG TPA: DUF1800 family protein, partial [Flavisolibacter sp.]|nr:DUF1800 family protein [Flavisolibacter sp.]
MITNQLKNQHLMWRAGFGPAASQLEQLKTISPDQLYKALKKASAGNPQILDVADDYLKGLMMGIGEVGQFQKKEMDKDERKLVQQKQRDDIKSLNLTWLNQMVSSDAQLREKMALFWHGH